MRSLLIDVGHEVLTPLQTVVVKGEINTRTDGKNNMPQKMYLKIMHHLGHA